MFPVSLILFGIVGWVASFGLTLERIKVAGDPGASTACDISPFISCKSVMLSEQAALLGFPNPLIGLAAFFAPVVVGFAILAGAKFASWFWQGM
ncbi:MAG: vitamin K epoxide reductase family protein, partial [Aquiluna sp.]